MSKIARQRKSANNGGLERNYYKKSIEGNFNSSHVQLHHKYNVSTVMEHWANNPFYAKYTEWIHKPYSSLPNLVLNRSTLGEFEVDTLARQTLVDF